MKKINKNTIVISSIDTFQTKDTVENRKLKVDVLPGQTKKYINDGIITTRWNPNHKGIINKLTETEEMIEEMYSMATVINFREIKMNRIDIHTDIDIEFQYVSKMLDMLFMSITEGMGKSRKEWIDKDDLQKESYWLGTQYVEVNFYNKKTACKNSGEKCEYPTRLEIRFKKIKSQDKKFHIDKAIKIYSDALERFKYAESSRIKALCDEWDIFKKENPKGTLTHFVIKYECEIYTRRILHELYEYVGLKGNFKSWVDKFKRGYKLELITEKDMKELIKRINISLKRYKNN
ncbi:MAG: hypothetical protein MR824_00710 [Fusobacterium mortiferum]|nr:hypothetical protein [Fusobacterium mortiferum]